jgi:hypothetical protein
LKEQGVTSNFFGQNLCTFPSFNEDIYIGLSLETCGFDDCTLEFGVNSHGNYIVSGKEIARYRQGGFESGDVIGCGLLILGESRNILFTKNGQIWRKFFYY